MAGRGFQWQGPRSSVVTHSSAGLRACSGVAPGDRAGDGKGGPDRTRARAAAAAAAAAAVPQRRQQQHFVRDIAGGHYAGAAAQHRGPQAASEYTAGRQAAAAALEAAWRGRGRAGQGREPWAWPGSALVRHL